MDAYENIIRRRSIRKYKADPVPLELVEKVVEAGRRAPIGMNTQLWHFTVVTDREMINRIGRFVQENDTSICYDAPVFIMVGYDKDNPFAKDDSACAMCAMMYAASALGLGSVWINRINRNPEKAAGMQAFGVPEGYRVFGCLALGYPDMVPEERVLREGTVTYLS